MLRIPIFACLILILFSSMAYAHFGMVIPSDSMVMAGEDKTVTLEVSFSHPFEMVGMDMQKPKVGVFVHGQKNGLDNTLTQAAIMDHRAWKADFKIARPGVYQFYVTPEPYWEPAEDCFIIHYAKTYVAAFGDEEGWDEPVGLETEIIPLTRPFGNYAGNLFQGQVLVNGKPAPYAEVEVEYYNKDKKAAAPTDYMITQVVKADAQGVFTYAVPKAGWWGFAALNTADYTISHEGEEKPVEIGAVIWLEFLDFK